MFVDIKAKTRGKGTREVTYKGIGEFVDAVVEKRDEDDKLVKDENGEQVMETVKELKTAGVVKDLKSLLTEAYKGNQQELIDDAIIGYNLRQFKLVSDALAEFIVPSWNAAQIAAFRLAVNNLVKLGAPLEMAVNTAKGFIK